MSPPRQTRPWRSRNLPSRCRARFWSGPCPRGRGTGPGPLPRPPSAPGSRPAARRGATGPAGQSRLSVFTRSPGATGINDGAITSHAHPRRPQLSGPARSRSGRPHSRRATADRVLEPVQQMAHRVPSRRDLFRSSGALGVRSEDPYRDRVLVDIQPEVDSRIAISFHTGHGGRLLFRMWHLPLLTVDDPREMRERGRPFHAD